MEMRKTILTGFLLATVAIVSEGQAAPAVKGSKDVSRVDLQLNYDWVYANVVHSDNFSLNGGNVALAFNLNRHWSLVGDFLSAMSGNVLNSGQDLTLYNYHFGARYSFRNYGRFTPYLQGLAGGSIISSNWPAYADNPTYFGTTAGGGIEMNWRPHIGFTLGEVDWLYSQGVNGADDWQNDLRVGAGVVFHFGHLKERATMPITLTCSASPSSVYPGDPVTIMGTTGAVLPKMTPVYTWTGADVTGSGETATVATAGQIPGTYTVNGTVKEGKGDKTWEAANCSANYTVKAYEPPTISCSVTPPTIKPGDSATVTSVGVSPQNRPLTYSYSASAGSVIGSGTTVEFSSSGAPTGAVGITCSASDDKGHSVSTSTLVNISTPAPPPPLPHSQALCSINFATDKLRPARVDNEAKACLDQVALDLKQQADARAVLVGQSGEKERVKTTKQWKYTEHDKRAKVEDYAAQRAVNAKNYLVTEQGIDASRISVVTGMSDGQRVENYLVPAGADFTTDMNGTTPVDESVVKPIVRKVLPKRNQGPDKKSAQ